MYLLNDSNALTISFKQQIADTQRINCYTFSSLTIGFCDEAQILIRNSKEKYKPLGDSSIMMIDGMNQELQIKLIKALDINIVDEYELYVGLSENKFDWLSPIEELTTGFISNLSFQGSTIGNLVSNEIRRLPQRNKWLFYKFGINLKKDFLLSKNVYFFYDFDYRVITTDGYDVLNSTPKNNMSIKSGLKFQFLDNLTLSISASLYKNNLYGYEDISFTQRSEHQFDKAFGSINSSLIYKF